MNKKNINTLISRYIEVLKSKEAIFDNVPDKCSKYEMTEELNELKDNFKNYPNEEICRKIGFVNGVINFDSPLVSVSINNPSGIKKLIKETLDKLGSYSDPYVKNEEVEKEELSEDEYEEYNDCCYMAINRTMLLMLLDYAQKAFNSNGVKELEMQYILGYVQGILALFSLIDMKEENELVNSLN